MKPKKLTVMISGGGTGGHIFPAVAIADEIRLRDPEANLIFVGAKGRMEMEKVPTAGYQIHGIWISGIQRKAIWKNVMFPFKLLSSLWACRKLVRKYQPDVVVGTGGFASGPLLQVAASKGIPCLIQEQNSFPGITNKILSKKAKTICVAYDNMERWFPKEKIRLTGNPVRGNIAGTNTDKKAALQKWGFDAKYPVILVTGGSLGAKKINEAIEQILPDLERAKLQLIWQCGSLYAADLTARVPKHAMRSVQAFVSDMGQAYAAADIVISRAGASTLSELALAGKAALLIPSPNVAEDHQTKNAMALVAKDAAKMLSESELSNDLLSEIHALLVPEMRKKFEDNIKALGKPNATKHIADELFKLIAS
jgi:UDP-N-acetylglucosamine--N-acetylmuramyl-(pentapeptide) pyrophosphoryl-undecaprenol N-acetylglucosamine transferase